jgi:hypothetical protein
VRRPRPRTAFVTPSHQFPTGVTLSMARRVELLTWARRYGAFIVKDDYTSEFRYSGPPLASLQGLDDTEQVIYIGTLNKALCRLLLLPPNGWPAPPAELVGGDSETRGASMDMRFSALIWVRTAAASPGLMARAKSFCGVACDAKPSWAWPLKPSPCIIAPPSSHPETSMIEKADFSTASAQRWGNRPASLWIAEDFGCCASG